jgi:hypothetical protein
MPAWPPVVLPFLLSLPVLAAEAPPADDIMGPLPPMELPALGPEVAPSAGRRAAVAGLAAGFVAVGFYYVVRRRARRPGGPSLAAWRTLAGEGDSLSDGEFYERLLCLARRGLRSKAGAPGEALTARELAARAPAVLAGEGEAGRWRALCRRAEGAEYARRSVDGERRRGDLEFVRDLLRRAQRRRAATEAARGM